MLLGFESNGKSRLRAASVVVLVLVLTPWVFGAPPTIHVPRIDVPPTLSDFDGMQPSARVAGHMLKVTGFIVREPADGTQPSQNTDVYLAYDQHDLYAVFVCWDTEPDKIRARMTRREDIFSDDSAEIMIDTFHDARRGYAFAANPFGIQWDALWTEGAIGTGGAGDFNGFDSSFDTVWRSEGRLTDRGYLVLIAIPFKSLRFPDTDRQEWGILLNRSIPRTNENIFWPRISNRIQGRFNQSATATGIEHISPGRNVQLIPYGLFRSFRDIDQRDPNNPFFEGRTLKPDVGLDSKFILHDRFVLDGTVNPDFSQVESDQPQITVNQRFEVFFPEKRPFFLENSNYFTTPINLVFTRRIAHPEFGLRLTGKSGPWAVGILASDDRAPGESVPPSDPHSGDHATFTIARVSRDILDQSTIGAIFTDREFGGGFNRVGGVDANIKINQNWRLQGAAVTSSTLNTDGSHSAGPGYKVDLERSGRQLNLQSIYLDYSPGFDTETGFVNRVDIRQENLNGSYFFRPEGKFLISWGPTLQQFSIWDHSGTGLDNFALPGLRVDMTRGTWVNFHPFAYDGVFLRPEDYVGLTRVKSYPQPFWGIEGATSWFKQFDFNWFFVSGAGVNYNPAAGRIPVIGHEDSGNFTLTLHASGRLRVDNTYLLEHIRERDTRLTAVTNHILRSKWNYQFNRELSARVILQYNAVLSNPFLSSLSPTKNFNADFLITYLVSPGTAIYVGYNSNLQNLDRRLLPTPTGLLTTRDDFINDGRQFFVKVSYLFRF
ncbi:MAG: carbohydrate binding family 9 domain-containing protein [Acidobacteriia bacterium]|nr:carbohydrate binding family 9 domain-containing protein [Terriglobia bacterium]